MIGAGKERGHTKGEIGKEGGCERAVVLLAKSWKL